MEWPSGRAAPHMTEAGALDGRAGWTRVEDIIWNAPSSVCVSDDRWPGSVCGAGSFVHKLLGAPRLLSTLRWGPALPLSSFWRCDSHAEQTAFLCVTISHLILSCVHFKLLFLRPTPKVWMAPTSDIAVPPHSWKTFPGLRRMEIHGQTSVSCWQDSSPPGKVC